MTKFYIYCDESCHGEKDGHSAMVLGSLQCPAARARQVADALRDLKSQHGLNRRFELKWTKVSRAKADYYRAVADYFFDDPDLSFRAIVVPDKQKLRHEDFDQTHDEFYYKLHFHLIRPLIDGLNEYRVFLDIKDTRSAERTRKLHDVLTTDRGDRGRSVIKSVDLIRSDQVEQAQLVDLLTGAVSYSNRHLNDNAGKLAVIDQLRKRSGRPLTSTTPPSEKKLNILCWKPQESAR